MKFSLAALALLASTTLGTAHATEGTVALGGVPKLDHVFVIMMENHGYAQIIGNPEMPFTNAEALSANLAMNYFAVAHPSLTNYLETVGGSNFGILNDNSPIWRSTSCKPNLAAGAPPTKSSTINNCPIAGTGMDTATPLIDYTNETSGPPGVIEIDGKHSTPPPPHDRQDHRRPVGRQRPEAGRPTRKACRSRGADGVNHARTATSPTSRRSACRDGRRRDQRRHRQLYAAPSTTRSSISPTSRDAVNGQIPGITVDSSAQRLVCRPRHRPRAELLVHRAEPVPRPAWHAAADPFCNGDPNDNGTQVGLNPGLMAAGDMTVQQIVTAIKASPVWTKGQTAIVIVWDESDYSVAPITNQVVHDRRQELRRVTACRAPRSTRTSRC